ncbi:MAG: CopG family antitoxin [Candidatus Woesebacteria bacterium]|jgi:hypothetical protein
MSENKIPRFKSVQEEANFWDQHDLTDYLPEMKKVSVKFFKQVFQKKEVLTIRLQTSLKKQLKKIAQHYNLSVSSLARMWLSEKLRKVGKTY